MPADIALLQKDQRKKIEEWCDQVPTLGFNSGSYDLNLIGNYFAEQLAGTTNKVRVAKMGRKNNVPADGQAAVPGHNKLSGPRNKLRQLAESVRM